MNGGFKDVILEEVYDELCDRYQYACPSQPRQQNTPTPASGKPRAKSATPPKPPSPPTPPKPSAKKPACKSQPKTAQTFKESQCGPGTYFCTDAKKCKPIPEGKTVTDSGWLVDYSETLDFARCQRPDGSYYGTSGQCRKGTPVGAKEQKAKKAKRSLRERFDETGGISGGAYGDVAITKEGTVIKKGRLGQDEPKIQEELAKAGLAPKVIEQEWTAMKPKNASPRMGIMEMELAKGSAFEDIQSSLNDKQKAQAADEYLRLQAGMHKRGIAHGDFHEQNFFFDPATGKGTAIDFGLSQRSPAEVIAEATGNQGLWGRGDWITRTNSPTVAAYDERRRAVVADMDSKGLRTASGRISRDITPKQVKDYITQMYGDL